MANIIAWMLLLSAMMGTAQAGGCRAANVSASAGFTCAVLQDGSARCWGSALFGKLGRPDNITSSDPNGPPLDFGAGRSVVQLATYSSSACALLDDHTLSCWGSNGDCQLGLVDLQNRDQPTHVQLGTGNQSVQLLSTGSTAIHSCAVVAGEGVFCWGYAGGLQGTPWLGKPNSQAIAGPLGPTVILPSKVDLGADSGSSLTVIDMCAGAGHTCILSMELGLQCWGAFTDGQLGLGNITDTTGLTGLNLPSVNLGTGRSAVQIACGDLHTCAVLDNGDLKCFGDGSLGRLGSGNESNRGTVDKDMGDNLKPVDVGKGRTVQQVTAGEKHTCALLDNGQVKCWGDNAAKQLGHHCITPTWGNRPGQMGDNLPAVDLGPGRTAVSISAGHCSCAVLDGGGIICWGDNTYGELGFSSNGGFVCPPDQTADLGSSCTSSTVGCSSTGPGNSSQLPSAPSPTSPTPTPSQISPTPQMPSPTPLQATISTPSTSTSPSLSPSPPPSTTTTTTTSTTASSSTATATPSPSSSHSAPAGTIAGAVIAAVVAVALSGFAVWWWRNRRQGSPTRGAASFFTRSKQPSAQVVAIASDEVAMNNATEVGAVHAAADIKLDMGAAINTVSTKADAQGARNSHITSTAAPSPGALPEARSTPPLTSTGSHKTDARDTNTSRAASGAAPSSGILREGSIEGMLISWSHITLGGLLGEGGFGKVYKAKWRMNTVAVKVLNMKKASAAAIDNLHREALIMSELTRHPCIARVFGVVDEDPHHALVMQYYPKGTLAKYLTTAAYAVLDLPAKLHIALQVASGMQFMHERAVPVLHGDLKAANILLTAPGRSIVIADFGLSQAMLVGQEAAVASGALTYSISPPEVLNNPVAPRTRAADVYAFAIVLLEIYTGMPCFRGMRVTDIRRLVTAGQRPSLPADMPPCIADIIKPCWSQDPASRPSFTDVVEQLAAAAAELHMDCITDGTVTAVSTQTMTDW